MDFIVQKSTELGVTEIAPVKTERGQSWLTGARAISRYGRWERIAREAARQSGRNEVPRIWPLTDFSEVLSQGIEAGLKLFFWEEEQRSTLKELLAAEPQIRRVQVLIGPEGGFSTREVAQATAAGFQSITLGRRVLRTETAVVAVVSLLQYELGDLGLLP
jgi:16S rRNA (uracil1498-N3)-methyltransferase